MVPNTVQIAVIASIAALALGAIPALAIGLLYTNTSREDLQTRLYVACERENVLRIVLTEHFADGKDPVVPLGNDGDSISYVSGSSQIRPVDCNQEVEN